MISNCLFYDSVPCLVWLDSVSIEAVLVFFAVTA